MHACSDASWEDGPSVSGHLTMLNGGILTWTSRRQHSTSLSSTEAETFAAASAAAEVMWLRGLLAELGLAQGEATCLWCDNSGAVAIGNDAGSLGRSKHIARRARFLTEALGSGVIRVRHVAGTWQLADVLTKPLEKRRFVTLTEHMMNTPNLVVTEGAREAGDDHEQGKQAELRHEDRATQICPEGGDSTSMLHSRALGDKTSKES